MKKIIALSVLALTVVLASGCGTTTPGTENGSTDTASTMGSCLVSFNNSCQDFENLNNYTVDNLKSDCQMVGTWSETVCPAEYTGGCKNNSTGITGGTYDVTIWYKKDDAFFDTVKSGCQGEWLER